MDKTIGTAAPWTKGRYDTIDYIITTHRWNNTIKDVYSDVWADNLSDHYQFVAKTEFNMKAEFKNLNTRKKYIKCTDDQRQGYNKDLIDNRPNAINLEDITSRIKTTGTEYIPETKC